VSRSGIDREAIMQYATPRFKEAALQGDGVDLSKLGIGDASLYTRRYTIVRRPLDLCLCHPLPSTEEPQLLVIQTGVSLFPLSSEKLASSTKVPTSPSVRLEDACLYSLKSSYGGIGLYG
jgi:hypothetical protein